MRNNIYIKGKAATARRLALGCLLLFAVFGSAWAQGSDGQFVIKKTKYNPSPGDDDHYLAHVYNTTTNKWELQDATEFSPSCLWYSGREYNLMGTHHNYYFMDENGDPRFLMAPLASGGALSISTTKPPIYLLNNTDQNYYFYDWDYDNRPEGAGVARGHQYNGITNQTDCEACEGGKWDNVDEECWAVYWVECDGTTWSLSTTSQYNITANSGRFRAVSVESFPMVISGTGGLDNLTGFDMVYSTPSHSLSASFTGVPFSYIPAYKKYEFNDVTTPDDPTTPSVNEAERE